MTSPGSSSRYSSPLVAPVLVLRLQGRVMTRPAVRGFDRIGIHGESEGLYLGRRLAAKNHHVKHMSKREDANTTLDKISVQNLNIIRKWFLSILKLLDIRGIKMSLRRKRFNIGIVATEYPEEKLKI